MYETYNPAARIQAFLPVAKQIATSIYGDMWGAKAPPAGYGDSTTAARMAKTGGSIVMGLLSQMLDLDSKNYQKRIVSQNSNNLTGTKVVNPGFLNKPVFGSIDNSSQLSKPSYASASKPSGSYSNSDAAQSMGYTVGNSIGSMVNHYQYNKPDSYYDYGNYA